MDSEQIKRQIVDNAKEIVRLDSRIDETFRLRSRSEQKKKEWQRACAEFRDKFDPLAFPGGYRGALPKISAGEANALEAAICFLELRPYFFRSGYMFKMILRRVKRAPLSPAQAARLEVVTKNLAEWRARKARHEA